MLPSKEIEAVHTWNNGKKPETEENCCAVVYERSSNKKSI